MTDLPDTAKKGGRTAWCVVACVTLCSLCSTNVAAAEEIPTRVLQRALSQAERVGTIDAVEVYGGTLEGAQQTLDPQAVPNSSGVGVLTDSMRETTSPGTQIDLVVAHGDFTDTFAKTPRYAEPPLGHIMAFAINPQTSWVLETYVGDLAPQTAGVAAALRPEHVLELKLRLGRSDLLRVERRLRKKAHRRRSNPKANAATWGNECSQGDGHHCYALAIWEMTGTEKVAGTEALQYTEEANVPTWEEGGFVDQEEWVGFYNGRGVPYWTEMGQAAGEEYDCCTMHWFWAYQNASGYHTAEPSERSAIGRDEYSAYFMLAAGSGIWCFDIGPYGELQVKCVGGFETYSKDLENGSEYAVNKAPTAWGHGLVNWWKEHEWYKAELGLYNESGRQSYNGMCVSKYAPVPAPGNINTGTYDHC